MWEVIHHESDTINSHTGCDADPNESSAKGQAYLSRKTNWWTWGLADNNSTDHNGVQPFDRLPHPLAAGS